MSETESLMLRILEGIQRDLAEMKRDLSQMKHDLAETKQDVTDTKVDVTSLRDEMQVGFAAVMRQGDRRFLDHEGRLRALEKSKRR